MRLPLSFLRLLSPRNPSSRIHHHSLLSLPSFYSTPSLPPTTDRVSSIVEDISSLTLLEAADLTETLRRRLGVEQMPVLAVMSPGMGFPGAGSAGGGGQAEEHPAAEEKKEKTAFDLKLEGFEAAAKIKIIKEVRSFTDLGLKEAKELVEKAPVVIKQGMPKEEAEKIAAKLKEIGAKVVLE